LLDAAVSLSAHTDVGLLLHADVALAHPGAQNLRIMAG
jgi:hypothetical protein